MSYTDALVTCDDRRLWKNLSIKVPRSYTGYHIPFLYEIVPRNCGREKR